MPEGEREEIGQLFAAKGFAGDDLERIVDVITSDPDVWVNTMMTEELGYGTDASNPLRAAATTLIAFVVVGFLPLGIAFLTVGGLEARFVEQPVWRSALETLAIGGVAAVLAYILGSVLQDVS